MIKYLLTELGQAGQGKNFKSYLCWSWHTCRSQSNFSLWSSHSVDKDILSSEVPVTEDAKLYTLHITYRKCKIINLILSEFSNFQIV